MKACTHTIHVACFCKLVIIYVFQDCYQLDQCLKVHRFELCHARRVTVSCVPEGVIFRQDKSKLALWCITYVNWGWARSPQHGPGPLTWTRGRQKGPSRMDCGHSGLGMRPSSMGQRPSAWAKGPQHGPEAHSMGQRPTAWARRLQHGPEAHSMGQRPTAWARDPSAWTRGPLSRLRPEAL